MSFVSDDFDFYSDIRFFFGGFTAAQIRRRIRLADFFSADIRRTKIRRLIQIFGGGLGVYLPLLASWVAEPVPDDLWRSVTADLDDAESIADADVSLPC